MSSYLIMDLVKGEAHINILTVSRNNYLYEMFEEVCAWGQRITLSDNDWYEVIARVDESIKFYKELLRRNSEQIDRLPVIHDYNEYLDALTELQMNRTELEKELKEAEHWKECMQFLRFGLDWADDGAHIEIGYDA